MPHQHGRDEHHAWVNRKQRIEARYANNEEVHVVGNAIAYTDQPTLVLLTDDGEKVSWLAELCHPATETAQDAEAREWAQETAERNLLGDIAAAVLNPDAFTACRSGESVADWKARAVLEMLRRNSIVARPKPEPLDPDAIDVPALELSSVLHGCAIASGGVGRMTNILLDQFRVTRKESK